MLRCLVYIDLNMVRAGVVDHPSKWPHGGFNEIQSPRRKNIIITHGRLCSLAGFNDYDTFAATHRKWVDAAVEKIDAKRESCWTESVAVGSSTFIDRIRNAMGAMAKGRQPYSKDGEVELREAQAPYIAFFGTKNRNIDPK